MPGVSVASPGPPKAPVAPPSPEGQPGRGLPVGMRVLIVEDEWLVSLEIEAVLDEAGYETVGVAISADEALALAEQHRPDFVLMDIRLSGPRDGVDAALAMGTRLGLRCLFISANNDRGIRVRAAPCQPLGWLAKPFSGEQLLAAMDAAAQQVRQAKP